MKSKKKKKKKKKTDELRLIVYMSKRRIMDVKDLELISLYIMCVNKIKRILKADIIRKT